MNLTLIQNHGLKYANKIDVLRGELWKLNFSVIAI